MSASGLQGTTLVLAQVHWVSEEACGNRFRNDFINLEAKFLRERMADTSEGSGIFETYFAEIYNVLRNGRIPPGL